jgi:acyl dehydratase
VTAEYFPIEAGHIMMFARSVNDYNEVYYHNSVAERAGFNHVPAPPTFMMAVDHYDETYNRRPQPGEIWFGSGRDPISDDVSVRPVPKGGSGFHAEERFIYHRHPVAGETLIVEYRTGKVWSKEGRRGGALTFTEEITEFSDAQGKPVITAIWVSVATVINVGDGKLSDKDFTQEKASDENSPERIEGGHKAVMAGKICHIGDTFEKIVVKDLKRTQLVMYSGASGDFHPFHHDEPFARAKGMDGVFAHGMLTMGITAIAFNDVIDDGALLEYGARFVQPVWPGETLTTKLIVTNIEQSEAQAVVILTIETRNGDSQLVLTGDARVQAANF